MCGEELASGALVELLAGYRLDPMAAFVVFPAGRRPSQRARAFSDYLEQALAAIGEEKGSSADLEKPASRSSRSLPPHPLRNA
jgi:hypothetical protein